jgi:hypothetical protein
MIRAFVVAAAVMAAPLPALAQTAEAPAAVQAAETTSPEEAAFEVRAEAFGQRIQTMAGEMQAAVAAGDAAKQDADLDAIQARYQPDVDAFVADLQAFVTSQTVGKTTEEVQGMETGLAMALPQIQGITGQVRSQVEQAAATAAATAAPATPPAP